MRSPAATWISVPTDSSPVPGHSSPVNRALVTAGATVIVLSAGWVWAVFTTPAESRAFIAWSGAIAGLVLCAAIFAAVLNGLKARDRRRLKWELRHLEHETLPEIVKQIHEGTPPENVLGGMRFPADSDLRSLIGAVAREISAAERSAAAANESRRLMEDEVADAASDTFPAMVKRMREGESAQAVLDDVLLPANGMLRALIAKITEEFGAEVRGSATALKACANVAARLQAGVNAELARLTDLQAEFSEDATFFATLQERDRNISQLGCLSDRIAVLSGGRSGRRWTVPITMEGVVRGGMARVAGYQRVRVHSSVTCAVVGYAAAAAVTALAELIDNATTYSNESTKVDIYVEEEDQGVIVRIDDAGVGMRRRERKRAEELVGQPMDLTMLPGTRLGLAVVGRLAARYGFVVEFRRSSRGGTGVIMLIPRALITQPPQDLRPAVPHSAASIPSAPRTPENQAGGLPKRRRGATLDEAPQHPAAADPTGHATESAPPSAEPFADLATFFETRHDSASSPREDPHQEQGSG